MPKKNVIPGHRGGSTQPSSVKSVQGVQGVQGVQSVKAVKGVQGVKLDFVQSLLSNVALNTGIIFNPEVTDLYAVQEALSNLKVQTWNDEALQGLTAKMSERLSEAALDDLYHVLLRIPRMTMRSDPGQRGGARRSRARLL